MRATEKNLELLSYIIYQRPKSSVTELMKLCYLIDLSSIKKGGEPVSDFKYIRYTYGPFDEAIYPCLKKLVTNGFVTESTAYAATNEYVTYSLHEGASAIEVKYLGSESLSIIDEVLNVMRGHGAKALTDVAYKTKPMQKLKATLGGSEHLNEELDMAAA